MTQLFFFGYLPSHIFLLNKKGNTIFLAIIACLLWSTAYAGIKLGLRYDTPFHFAGIRFIISGLIILPFTVSPRKYFTIVRENWRVIGLVTLFQIIINYALFYLGLEYVPGALGAIIAGSQPLVTALIAAMLHEGDKLTRRKMVTIVSGISGVVLISAGRQAFHFGTALELLGVGMILIANISLSIGNIIVSLRSRGMHPLVLSSASIFSGGVVLYLISIPVEGFHSGPFPKEYWMILLWLSFMAATAFSIWFTLLQRPGVLVSELNLWKFIIPVVGAVISWLIVPGEKPEWITISGMVIITSSLIMFFGKNKKAGFK
jgi:drug/metabolite transporter (DMT)-like permease